ncbi:Hypothetical protein PBC10988_36870 [Planctomycetales bacterium 10988]|nr:Hypothetical protein PBC10988_36870 [Planctomycetales bacterium 10988]
MYRSPFRPLILLGLLLPVVCLYGQPPQPEVRRVFDQELESLFFDNALEAVGEGSLPGDLAPQESSESGTNSIANLPTMTGMAASTPSPGASMMGGGGLLIDTPAVNAEWGQYISTVTLEDEVKKITNDLTLLLRSKGKFKSQDYRTAQMHFTTLTTLFGIIAQYGGDVRWQYEAAPLRNILSQAAFSCDEGSDESYSVSESAYQTLNEVVRGIKVVFPDVTSEEANWGELVYLGVLMNRMEKGGRGDLRQWTANPTEFESNMPAIKHEAEIMAAYGKIIQDPNFGYEDQDYRGFAEEMLAGALGIKTAVEQEQFDLATESYGKFTQACDTCHGSYR